jgi:hypothetical protein
LNRRGYRHQSPLDAALATGESEQRTHIDTLQKQRALLKKRGCGCRIN